MAVSDRQYLADALEFGKEHRGMDRIVLPAEPGKEPDAVKTIRALKV
ncbi:MAG: hypothetical protein V1875_00585 [Candidatus Altiarchaeota archaeon]